MNNNNSIDEKAANDLVKASELYRIGEYEIALMLIDKAITRSMIKLLQKNKVDFNENSSLRQLLSISVKKQLITNKKLITDIILMHDLRNQITHGKDTPIENSLIQKYLDIGYELVGTIPYKEELFNKFMKFRTKQIIQKSKDFKEKGIHVLEKLFGKDNVQKQPRIGLPGSIFRPDALVTKNNKNILVEFKNRTPRAVFQIANLVEHCQTAVSTTNSSEFWLILPESEGESAKKIQSRFDLKNFKLKILTSDETLVDLN